MIIFPYKLVTASCNTDNHVHANKNAIKNTWCLKKCPIIQGGSAYQSTWHMTNWYALGDCKGENTEKQNNYLYNYIIKIPDFLHSNQYLFVSWLLLIRLDPSVR